MGPDASHDWWHIERVRNLALSLADQENLEAASREIVEHAALLHDVADWKYSGSEDTSHGAVKAFLQSQGVEQGKMAAILAIIAGIGFKDELANGCKDISKELAVVQDADRLDAIGAVGIARCFTFGGRFNRVLHDPSVKPRDSLTKQAYMDKTFQQTTINHFHEKLLKLKDMMKTESGKRMAQHRHRVMEEFVTEFYREWDGLS
ncbi:g8754 [Coccomyxa elongata]